jgi:hypothetical protein
MRRTATPAAAPARARQAPATRGCAAGRAGQRAPVVGVIIPTHDHRCARRVRIAQRPAIPALTVSAASGAPIRACRRFRFLPRRLAARVGAVIIILGQGGTYGYLRCRVTGLLADPGQSAPRG